MSEKEYCEDFSIVVSQTKPRYYLIINLISMMKFDIIWLILKYIFSDSRREVYFLFSVVKNALAFYVLLNDRHNQKSGG